MTVQKETGSSDTTGALGATVDQLVRLDGWKFVVALPEHAGRVCGLAHYRGKLLITTDRGHLYEWDGEREILRSLPASFAGIW